MTMFPSYLEKQVQFLNLVVRIFHCVESTHCTLSYFFTHTPLMFYPGKRLFFFFLRLPEFKYFFLPFDFDHAFLLL